MFYLVAFLIAVPSSVVWVLNAEALAVLVGLVGERPWPLVALALAAGQSSVFLVLFLGGERLTRRWAWLRRRVEAVTQNEERLARYRRATGWTLALAAAVGVPPLIALSVVAPALGVRLPLFFGIAFGGRFARFALLAGVPHLFSDLFPVERVPDWLLSLL